MMRLTQSIHGLTSALLVASSRGLSSAQTISQHTVRIPPENLEAIRNLEPQSLWSQFAAISSIPRPSKKEHAVLSYIKTFAEERNLSWKQDAVGNLVVFHPGNGKGKSASAVVIQGHVDMVTEKNSESSHNFETDPILLRQFTMRENETWLGARDTTLGADNGIGVAAALALLDTPVDEDSIIMPPIEALFTIDEETGLTGAAELDAKALGLTGKTMLNLDMEEWGELYVGCAGGGESSLTLPLTRSTTSINDAELVEIKVDGLMGGHSGLNIHEGRANAILLCAMAAQSALKASSDVSLVSITGGDKHNAIPREAIAKFSVSTPEAKQAVQEAATKCAIAAKAEYGALETNLHITFIESNMDSTCQEQIPPLEKDSATRLVSMLMALPHGPIKFSHAMPDLVETSNNIASITMPLNGKDEAIILCSTRSSIGDALESTRNRLAAIAALAGASIEKSTPYPGWNPNMKSPLLQLGKDVLLAENGNQPAVKAVHAGLECGLLIEKMGGDVDALSFGPTIEGAHSPDERIHADTVPLFYAFVQEILAKLAEK